MNVCLRTISTLLTSTARIRGSAAGTYFVFAFYFYAFVAAGGMCV